MVCDWLKVKLSATRIVILLVETIGSSLPGRHAAGTAFVLTKERTASHCDKYLSAVYRLRFNVFHV